MSNKLEELGITLSEDIFPERNYPHYEAQQPAFQRGFEEALALNLPVKFAMWINKEYASLSEARVKNGVITNDQLYKYWLENIYKPD